MTSNTFKLAVRAAFVCAAVAILVAFATTSALAQTTGQIIGTIVDAQGGVLPGVTVTASSPQLQGTRTAVTDGSGTFRFPTLPPGTNAIKANLAGFQDAAQENVTVSLDRSASLNLKMQVAASARP